MDSAMLAAIKHKKAGQAVEGDHQDSTHMSQHTDDKTKDLHAFVQNLNEDDKGKLKNILAKDGGTSAMDIAKGAPSSEEAGKIDGAIQKENASNALQAHQDELDHPQVDSDEIGKSMLDHKSMNAAESGAKPRNLGERVKMNIASKLKAKGKI